MHHIFELDEIIRLIANNLVDIGCNRGALSLACCCKLLSVPVLDTMWEWEQTDLTTLIMTFPPDLWEATPHAIVSPPQNPPHRMCVNTTATQFLVRGPSEDEWDRFSAYARRMRNLSITPHTVFPTAPTFELLATRFLDSSMLPNLLELEWWHTDASIHIPGFLRLLLPTVSLITLDLSLKNIPDPRKVLSVISPIYNTLQCIYITGGDSDLVQEFSTLLFNCNPRLLRAFYVDGQLSRTAFIHASQLPRLLYLGATVQPEGQEPLGGASLPAMMFSSLQYLGIKEFDTDSIWMQSLERICSTSLEMLALELVNVESARTILHLALANLHRGGPHRALTELMVDCEGGFCGLEVDTTTVKHLLPFTQLTTLNISFVCGQDQCGYKFSDKDVEKLVKAMPKLEHLALGKKPCSLPANNSDKSLLAIARHCKHLKTLLIHANVQAVMIGTSDYNHLPGEDQGCNLHSITFGPCFIPDGVRGAWAFASKLLRIFPHLDTVNSSDQTQQWWWVSETVTTCSICNRVAPTHVGEPVCLYRVRAW